MRVSQTEPGDSYGAVFTLQAWDMLHGNLLLHGWWLSDVSFYTTELPEYMLVDLVRGLNPDVVHVAAAITFTLLLLLAGLRALENGPRDPAAVAEAFVLKLLSLSGFHPSLSACAGCGRPGPHDWFAAGQGGIVCPECAEHDAGRVSPQAAQWLHLLSQVDLEGAGDATPDVQVRRDARAMLYGFAEYHLDRRIRSFTLLARQPQPERRTFPVRTRPDPPPPRTGITEPSHQNPQVTLPMAETVPG